MKTQFTMEIERDFDGLKFSYPVTVRRKLIEQARQEWGPDQVEWDISEAPKIEDFALFVVDGMEFNNTRDAIAKFLDIAKQERHFRATDLMRIVHHKAREIDRED